MTMKSIQDLLIKSEIKLSTYQINNYSSLEKLFDDIHESFEEHFDYLIHIIKIFYDEKVDEKFVFEDINSNYGDKEVLIVEKRIRPNNNFYKNSDLEIPFPENPIGQDATGLEISIKIAKMINREISLDISFQVWGAKERSLFKNLFIDYESKVIQLLENINFNFFSSVPFDSVNCEKDVIQKLKKYLNEIDEENNFNLTVSFGKNDFEKQTYLKSFLIFYIIFASCYDFFLKGKNNLILGNNKFYNMHVT